MTIRERILTALTGGLPDQVPLTVYDWLLPRGAAERRLRAAGVGLIVRLPPHRVAHRNVEIRTSEYYEQGQKRVRRTIHTPVGDAWETLAPDEAYGTSNWIQEYLVKTQEDYRVLEYYFQDMVFQDNLDAIREGERRVGDDGVVFVRIAKSPVQDMLYTYLGLERFAEDYQDRRDLFDSLHATMVKRYAELYDLAAETPVTFLQLGDNIYSDMVGRERYQNYLMPEYAKIMARIAGTRKRLPSTWTGIFDRLPRTLPKRSLTSSRP
jgi:hypothetical protein